MTCRMGCGAGFAYPKSTIHQRKPMESTRSPFRNRDRLISTDHYLTTMAGLRLLEQWGHAADAGMAAGPCLNMLCRNQRTSAVLHPP